VRKAHARPLLGHLVFEAHQLTRGIEPDRELLLLGQADEPGLPAPQVQARGHHPVRLLEAEFALEVGLRLVVEVEYRDLPIPLGAEATAAQEIVRALADLPAAHAEIDRGLGKRLEEEAPRDQRPRDSQRQEQRRPEPPLLSGSITGHALTSLSLAHSKDPSSSTFSSMFCSSTPVTRSAPRTFPVATSTISA